MLAAGKIRAPTGPRNWPSFRGDASAGNGDGQRAIHGLGRRERQEHQVEDADSRRRHLESDRVGQPRVRDDRVSSAGNNSVKTGLYGDVKPVDDFSPHEWKLYCLDKATGKILWERTRCDGRAAHQASPKSSQASSTPVTDGRRVIAVFGSAGAMIAWDYSGKELWRVTLGTLDSGWFFDPAFQWGHSSSPIIYRNAVILQADVQKGSYIAAWDIATGKPLWRPSALTRSPRGARRRSHGPLTAATSSSPTARRSAATIRRPAKQLWTLGPNSEITIGTPVAGNGLVYVTGGYPPVRPIYAIRPAPKVDISLQKGRSRTSRSRGAT
jgi:hypothetical protein